MHVFKLLPFLAFGAAMARPATSLNINCMQELLGETDAIADKDADAIICYRGQSTVVYKIPGQYGSIPEVKCDGRPTQCFWMKRGNVWATGDRNLDPANFVYKFRSPGVCTYIPDIATVVCK